MQLFRTKSFTGISDYEDKGVFGAFKFGQNLDIRKATDSLSCGQALADDLAVGTLDSLPLFIVNSSNGNAYLFLRNGKIYKRTSLGVYSLVYTDADGVITGASEWANNAGDKYLIWATSTKLRRKELSTTGGSATEPWTDVDATFNSQTYPKTNLTAATWHTMLEMSGALYICNASTLALVGWDDSYTNNALQLVPNNNAKCLMEYNGYAYIGCSRDDNGQRAYLFTWDMAQSLNWNTKRKQGASPINALIDAELPLMQVGSGGKIRLADTSQYTLPIKAFPGGGSANPDGVEADDLAYFGMFGNTADSDGTIRTGIYTFGRVNHNANAVMNLEYLLDCDEIGSVKKVGADLLITYYKAGSGYGVKKVSTTAKATGLYQTIDFKAPASNREIVWSMVKVAMKALPSGCSISVRRRINKTGDWLACKLPNSQSSVFSTTGATEATFLMGDAGKFCEVEITLNPSANTTPEIYYFDTIFE